MKLRHKEKMYGHLMSGLERRIKFFAKILLQERYSILFIHTKTKIFPKIK